MKDDSEPLRRSIFKNELNYIFEKNNILDSVRQRIVSELFENPLTIYSQFLLKDEISSASELDRKLLKIIQDRNIINAIKSLLTVKEDLQCPSEIKNLFLRNENVCFFIGAGVSKLLGYPLWNELANEAIKYLYEECNLINYFEYKRILNEVYDPKQKLTIFDSFLPRSSEKAKEFYKKNLTKNYKNNAIQNPYELLVKFENALKLTTNIDNEFYKALSEYLNSPDSRLFYNQNNSCGKKPPQKLKPKKVSKNFNYHDLDYNTIYYLHGCIGELEETILTTRDYLDAYYKGKNNLRDFLRNVFGEYTIIFIGSGMEEFPILEHIIKNPEEKAYKPHYVLIGTYFNELSFFKIKRKYFKSLDIIPLSYYLDFSGYYRLYTVLRFWLDEIRNARISDYYSKVKIIDEVL